MPHLNGKALCRCLIGLHIFTGCFIGDVAAVDNACGARCVVHVAQGLLGTTLPLVPTISQLQLNSGNRVPSMHDLQEYMKELGLEASGRKVDVSGQLVLHKPSLVKVVIHFLPENPSEIGHFVLWEGTSNSGDQIYWDGLKGIQYMDPDSFNRKFSGAMLLVEAGEGALFDSVTVKRAPGYRYLQHAILTGSAALLTCFLVSSWFNQRKENQDESNS